MRVYELKQKEVINTCNCKNIGCPVDVGFDPVTGQITELVIPGPGKLCSFLGRDSEYCIPWSCICQIGEDIILVNIQEECCLKKL
ncbi:MAG: YlmC/YmxH family sporulation protein [Clostridia bacterium]|nr:YlmC/YmxH family sporulation protein [Clostridia bacterium]NCC44139.1 YlmC/YmxH family sporulation protein [Clostridia bacterium]